MTDFAAKSQLYFWKIVNSFAPQLQVHLYIQGFYNIEISWVFQIMYVIGFDDRKIDKYWPFKKPF